MRILRHVRCKSVLLEKGKNLKLQNMKTDVSLVIHEGGPQFDMKHAKSYLWL